ncbi:MAG: ArnT family glycosyltransferase [Gemmatimonadota bacterium]
MNRHRLPISILAAVLIGGSAVRLVDLGQASFNGDELDHVYAARSIQQGAGAILPSGNEYRRGSDITRIVSFTLGDAGSAETAARLPSAILGIAGLLLIAWVGWRLGGPWTAVWTALLLGIYPQAIIQSRMTRFYTYQLLFGLVALYAGWRPLRRAGAREEPSASEWRADWAWAVVAVAALLLALRVQLTTLTIGLAWAACVVLAAIADGVAGGLGRWRRSVPMQLTGLGFLGLLAFAAVRPGVVGHLIVRAVYVPAWTNPGAILSYYWWLADVFPVLMSLLPLALLAVYLRDRRLAVYLGVWFALPVLLHSLVFPWKGERYILLAVPALFLAGAIGASDGLGALRRELAARLPAGAGAGRLSTAVVAAIALFALATTPAFNRARRIPAIPKAIDWPAALERIEALPGARELPLGSSIGLPALYYWGRVDFVVGSDFLQQPGNRDGRPDMSGALSPQGTPDWYSGAPVLTTPDAIRARYPEAPGIVFAIDTDRWTYDNIDPDLREILRTEGRELCGGRCGSLLLYLWTPERS